MAAREADPAVQRAAWETLVSIYWRPVYGRLRLKWRAQPADAEDLAQEFFARAMDRGFFDSYDPARARFRTFLRTCLDRFAAKARREERRLKRGGALVHLPLDFAGAERELGEARSSSEAEADEWFEREWVRSLFSEGVEALRASCAGTPKEIRFRVFERYDLLPAGEDDRPSYRALAEELGLPITQVTNHLAWARRQLRGLVLDRLRVLSGSDAEVREEAAALLGTADR
jgi:RNA polymerase sigma factor (sigma-70 family)